MLPSSFPFLPPCSQVQSLSSGIASTRHLYFQPLDFQAGLRTTEGTGQGRGRFRHGRQFFELLVCSRCLSLGPCRAILPVHTCRYHLGGCAIVLNGRLTPSHSAMCERQITVPNTSLLYCSERYVVSPIGTYGFLLRP